LLPIQPITSAKRLLVLLFVSLGVKKQLGGSRLLVLMLRGENEKWRPLRDHICIVA
jgi:hypothetical protein